MRVRDWMRPYPSTCVPGDGLDVVVRRMRNESSGCVVVVDDRRCPIGIVTDRDVRRASDASAKPLHRILASEAMTASPVACRQDDDVAEAASNLVHGEFRRLPVVNRAGFLVGILALDDLAWRRKLERPRVLAGARAR
jgi:CBS domain-containing protein